MKTGYVYIVLFCCLLTCVVTGYAQNTLNDSLKMDVFLNKDMLKNASLNVEFTNSIDYTPTGFLLLSSSDQFYMLGLDGIPAIFNKTKTAIDAFTVMPNNELWVVSGSKLCKMDSQGNLSTISNLPISKAGIVSDNNENVAYIYDRTFQKGKREYAIYQSSNKQCTRLASTSSPIQSAFEYKTSLLFSSENKILCADKKTNTFFDFFSLPQKQNIISITGDTINHVLYFSTQDTIYKVQNGRLEYVCMEFGGTLKYDGEGLLVFNSGKGLIVRLRNNLLYPSEIERQSIPKTGAEDYLAEDELKSLSLNEVRKLLLQNRISAAVGGYAYLVAKDSLNLNLLAEYSYALALNGAYDCSLVNLERVRSISPKNIGGKFYASLVFSLMGYEDISKEFIRNIPASEIPTWITFEDHVELSSKHQPFIQLIRTDYDTGLQRANTLAASRLYLQSMAFYEEIIQRYPSEYLPHLGYSIVLEKLGLYQKSIHELEMVIKLIDNDPTLTDAKEVFKKRKAELNDKIQSPQKPKNRWSKFKNDFNPQTMLYAGGMITDSSVAIDSRFGLYLSNTFNGALDLGVNGISDNCMVNLGLSGYQRFGVLMAGSGLGLQIGNSTVLNLKTSLGLSFINRKRNSSFDIFFDLYLPLSNGKTSYGISIGKSFYFGKRK